MHNRLARAAARLVLAVAVSALSATATEGQTAEPAAPPAGTAPPFVIQTDNGDNRLQIGTVVHFDGRFAVDDPNHDVLDTFQLRRLRSILQGRVARYFDFYLNVDFAGGAVVVKDAWVETHFSNAFRVRAGKGKAPISYDRLILVSNILFVERGYTTQVAPDRDTGLQVLGDIGPRLSYAVSLTNGVVDGQSSDTDSNENKDVAGRLLVRPFAANAMHPLAGLGFAFAANTGIQAGPLPTFLTSGRSAFFSYSGAVADGRRTRWTPQAFYYHGPLGAYGEYIRSRGGVRKNGIRDEVDHDAWQVVASWVLTGEAAGERNVRPKVNFDPPSHHFGALQLTARYHALGVSPNAVALGFASPTASRTADAWTAGLNWYLNPFIKWNVNFERTVFDDDPDGAHRHPENAILLRAHLGF